METTCFGCCSLRTGVVVAAVFSVLQSAIGLSWNIQLLNIFDDDESSVPLKIIMNVDDLEDYDVVHGLTLASTGLHILWIIFIFLALKGNVSLTHGLLTPYKFLTYIITLFDIGATIYFSVQFQKAYVVSDNLFDHEMKRATKTLTYLVLMALFSKGLLIWFVNVYFAHLVDRRGGEIDHNNATLALYILSQLSRDLKGREYEHFPPPPPAYHPSYLPDHIADLTQDSLESSWSLNADSLQDVQGLYGSDPGFINRMYPHLAIGQHQVPQQIPGTNHGSTHNVTELPR